MILIVWVCQNETGANKCSSFPEMVLIVCVCQNETGATDNDDYDSEDERERKLLNLQVNKKHFLRGIQVPQCNKTLIQIIYFHFHNIVYW